MNIAALYTYPFKSCAGIPVREQAVSRGGFESDRQFFLVDPGYKILTLRDKGCESLVLVRPRIVHGRPEYCLEAPRMQDFYLPIAGENGRQITGFFRELPIEGIDQGNTISEWFSTFLHLNCRVIRVTPKIPRKRKVPEFSEPMEVFAQDSAPLSVISLGSIYRLSEVFGQQVDVRRFRPNIYVNECRPFTEQISKSMSSGSRTSDTTVEFQRRKWITRCKIINVNPDTGERDLSLTDFLQHRWKGEGAACFGTYFVPTALGRLHKEDSVVEALDRSEKFPLDV